ncbi:adenylate kinase [Cucumispora dikerogammari]|nr:adenylate kinase [Cucumispora dikerogammari]
MIVLLVPPGGGLKTIVNMIVEDFNMIHINLGKILQDEGRKDPLINKILENYESIPDPMSYMLFEKQLEKYKHLGINLSKVLLESFPFTLEAAKSLNEFINRNEKKVKNNYKIDCVIWCQAHIKATVYRVMKRDEERNYPVQEVAEFRYKHWLENTNPVKAYYEKKGLLKVINIEAPRFAIREIIDATISKACNIKNPCTLSPLFKLGSYKDMSTEKNLQNGDS